MTTTLITGANKGLGLETARRLVEAGHTVWVGARDAERGRVAADAVVELATRGGTGPTGTFIDRSGTAPF